MKLSMELCKGRHETPATDGAIFDTEVDPLKILDLENHAYEKLVQLQVTELDLYITGLTVALIAVLNAARTLSIPVILHHFDVKSKSYYSQKVN